MGGGGRYVPPYSGITDIEKLKDIARKELKKTPPKPRKKVFLSFRGEDLDLVNLFRGQAKNQYSDLDFIDFSLRVPFNSKNAEYIKRGIRERIKQSSVTVVLITETSYKSRWINWEIRESLLLGKGVVAVKLKDRAYTKIPNALKEHGIKPVEWDHKKIKHAIDKAAQNQ